MICGFDFAFAKRRIFLYRGSFEIEVNETALIVEGAPLAQFLEYGTLDHKVTSSNLTMGAVLCP